PALVLNTIQVEDGRRVVISPFEPTGRPFEALKTKLSWFYSRDGAAARTSAGEREPPLVADIKLSTAAVLSARFPWLLPPATVWKDGNFMRLMDGGLFENSGIDTAVEIVGVLAQYRRGYEDQRDALQQRLAATEKEREALQRLTVLSNFDIYLFLITRTGQESAPGWPGTNAHFSPA